MVRVGADVPRRSARHVRYDDIPTDTFTPRTYQVELLESALRGNTIACLGSENSKVFLGLMVMEKMSHQIRSPLEEAGKRSIYLADSEDVVDSLWMTLHHHTDLAIGRASPKEAEEWSAGQWMSTLATHNIMVLSAPVFLRCLDNGYLPLSAVNLLVLDNCHRAVGDHPYVGIMAHIGKAGDASPHLLCLTAAILGSECSDPKELAERIRGLETTLHSKAETSMLVISERFGCRPKESVMECEADDDVMGMGDQLAAILYDTWSFLEDSQVVVDGVTTSDPLHVPKFAISECINILQTLGSWCAASIAENLISQLEKIVKHESKQTLKLFLRYTLTQLRLVVRTFEIGFTPDYLVDELLKYTTPKVREFVNILRRYKPEMDFMIITRDGDGDETDISDDDDDSLDLSGSDDEDEDKGGKSSKHIHVAVKKRVERADGDNSSPFEDEKKLSGLVFVNNRYVAFALNKMMEEVCSWDENLCFVKSSYITGGGVHRSDGRKDLSNASRKQEEILRRFRMQERNLLVSTSILEEGVDIPKCNLVIRFDPPRDYRSYTLSKGRARARDAEYVILVDEELMEDFSEEIQVFKGIEQVLIGAGRGRQDLEDAQEVQQLDFTALPPFCPLNQPGAATVSMKNSIALINRYCAKLPSDAFTHLTPHCSVCPAPSDPAHFVAYLRLPVNSPIKEELMGPVMPSRQLAKTAVALQMCQLLFKAGELDCHLQPVGKEMFVCEEEEEWEEEEEEEGVSQARPGTTKRKQYYIRKPADAFVGSQPKADEPSFLYHVTMTLTGPITEDQNTRGRKIYSPQESSQSFGVLLSAKIPHVPSFPVYTRSGEVTVCLQLLEERVYSGPELEKLLGFHHFVFSSVLHLEKDPMLFAPETANIGFVIVPLNQTPDCGRLEIEWSFVEEVNTKTVIKKNNVFDGDREVFHFQQAQFDDAVVMPSYRNIDQPQHFYVAEIRSDLSPLSPFPSPELYKTFAAYYTTKYGLTLTNTEQPLLDVDHTSARLNLLTPRYMNQKGRALPTSSLETKRARRENLQQKQILVPELCDIHVFSASLWRKAVCLPAILYRMNYLLLAEELRKQIASETGIGKVQLSEGFAFPRLDFGFETNPEKLQSQKGDEEQTTLHVCSKKGGCPSGCSGNRKNERPLNPVKDGAGGKVQGEGKPVHDSSPDDDKTDTGASSDSDSGVNLSESDTSCASQLARVASSSSDLGVKSASSANSLESPSSGELTDFPSVSKLDKRCETADPFITPATSRPSSPTESDSSDESVYEDAEETVLEVNTSSSSTGNLDCDTDAHCQTHKPLSQSCSSSSPQSAPFSTASSTFQSSSSPSSSTAASLSSSLESSPSSISSKLPTLLSDNFTGPSLVLGEEGADLQSDVYLPQSLEKTCSCSQSQKVPDHPASVISCHCQCNASATGELSAMNSDLNQHGHISNKPQNQPGDSAQPGPLSDRLNHGQGIVCDQSVTTKIGEHHDHIISDTQNEKESKSTTEIVSENPVHLNEDKEKETKLPKEFISEKPKHFNKNKEQESKSFKDCDDFLDVTGVNGTDHSQKGHTVTFPVDPEISQFTKPTDEVKMTFSSVNTMGCADIDANWAQPSTGGTSGKEWAPDEDLTTFDVGSNLGDLEGMAAQNSEKVFNEDPPQKSKLPTEFSEAKSKDTETKKVISETVCQSHYKPEMESCSSHAGEDDRSASECEASGKDPATALPVNNGIWTDSDSASNCASTNTKATSLSADKESAAAKALPESESKPAGNSVSGEGGEQKEEKEDPPVAEDETTGWGDDDTALDPSEWSTLLNTRKPNVLLERNHEPLLPEENSFPDPAAESVPLVCEGQGGNKTENSKDTDEQSGIKNAPDQAGAKEKKESAALRGRNPVSDGIQEKNIANKDAQKESERVNESTHISEHRKQETTTTTAAETETSVKKEPLPQQQQNTSSPPPPQQQAPPPPPPADQFTSIGTWNSGKKKAVVASSFEAMSSRDRLKEVTLESRPLLISLDEDTDLETFMGPSPCLLLQALTMSNSNDFFSLERLETIGDSFLKYAITVYLYCCYPGTHEGKLSYLRSKQVSNYNLYRLGRRKGLAERMVSAKFEPYENWLPPGYIISEERRRGPVPKVVIATSNPKLSAAAPVNFLIEEEGSESDEDQKKETDTFHALVEELDRQQAVDQQLEVSSGHKNAMVPYCLQLHHGIPDKSVADCVEALIGCYLTTCGKQAALTFMSWLGLKVLPRKCLAKKRKKGQEVNMSEFQELQCPPSPLLRSVPEAEGILNRLLEGFSEFEARIDYTFRDRSYLLQAFTHASYHYNYITDCYQRLEFLGDAILDYVITRHLYEDSQRYSPGILTDLRSALVNNNIFAALAVKWDFHKFFKAISPSLFIVIHKFVLRQKERQDQIDEIEEVKKPGVKKSDEDEEDEEGAASASSSAEAAAATPADGPSVEAAGGGEREEDVELEIPKALGDIFESVAGAIYLDSGMSLDTVWRVYYRMMKPHIDKYLKDIPKSPVRELLETEPETAKFEKPQRTLEGKIRVTVNVVGKGVFYGVGRNYRIAKSAAAKKALRFIRNLQNEGLA